MSEGRVIAAVRDEEALISAPSYTTIRSNMTIKSIDTKHIAPSIGVIPIIDAAEAGARSKNTKIAGAIATASIGINAARHAPSDMPERFIILVTNIAPNANRGRIVSKRIRFSTPIPEKSFPKRMPASDIEFALNKSQAKHTRMNVFTLRKRETGMLFSDKSKIDQNAFLKGKVN